MHRIGLCVVIALILALQSGCSDESKGGKNAPPGGSEKNQGTSSKPSPSQGS